MSRPLIQAAGGVVYTYAPDGALHLLLIRDRHGAWTLPKGHLEPGEADEAAALREIAEETGIFCTLERPLARVRYPVIKGGIRRQKEVAYFLARAPFTPPIPSAEESIVEAIWASPATALATLTYAQVREVVQLALEILDFRF